MTISSQNDSRESNLGWKLNKWNLTRWIVHLNGDLYCQWMIKRDKLILPSYSLNHCNRSINTMKIIIMVSTIPHYQGINFTRHMIPRSLIFGTIYSLNGIGIMSDTLLFSPSNCASITTAFMQWNLFETLIPASKFESWPMVGFWMWEGKQNSEIV